MIYNDDNLNVYGDFTNVMDVELDTSYLYI